MNDLGIRNHEEITLDSDTFSAIRETFDLLLQKLFKRMEQSKSDEGSITLKVDVTMQEDSAQDESGEIRLIHKPVLKHKITTAVPIKDSLDGKKETGMDLVYDDDLKRYVLRYANVGGQRSIFDQDFMQQGDVEDAGGTDGEYVVDGAVKSLPGPGVFLPAPKDPEESDDEQEDDDYGYDEPEESV